MSKNTTKVPNVSVFLEREQIQKERYESQIKQLKDQINSLQQTIQQQKGTIGNLQAELKYKNNLIDRLTNYANINEPKSKKGFISKFFKRSKVNNEKE